MRVDRNDEGAWTAWLDRPSKRNALDEATRVALTELVDELADIAGESFTLVTALAGAGYKLEFNLAQFYRRHVAPSLGGSHLPLLTGFDAPTGPARHAVASLDWWHAPGPRAGSATRPA